MDKLSAMQAFVRVVERGTFTKAADSLGVPKAAVTRWVQLLEEDLKTRLFNRTTRRVTPTADGVAYYERIVPLLEEIDEVESAMSHAQVHPRGKLRIDVPLQVANLVLIPAMEDFCVRFPDIRLEIGVSDKPVDLLSENVDCVLRAGTVTDQTLVARRIADVPRVLCASPAYLKHFGVPEQPADLEDPHHRVIASFARGGEHFNYVLQRGGEQHVLNVRSPFAVNDSSSMLAAALAGLGITRASAFAAAPHIATGALQIVLPDWSVGVWPLYVVYPSKRHVSAKLRVFIDWVTDLCARKLHMPPTLQGSQWRGAALPALTNETAAELRVA